MLGTILCRREIRTLTSFCARSVLLISGQSCWIADICRAVSNCAFEYNRHNDGALMLIKRNERF